MEQAGRRLGAWGNRLCFCLFVCLWSAQFLWISSGVLFLVEAIRSGRHGGHQTWGAPFSLPAPACWVRGAGGLGKRSSSLSCSVEPRAQILPCAVETEAQG